MSLSSSGRRTPTHPGVHRVPSAPMFTVRFWCYISGQAGERQKRTDPSPLNSVYYHKVGQNSNYVTATTVGATEVGNFGVLSHIGPGTPPKDRSGRPACTLRLERNCGLVRY